MPVQRARLGGVSDDPSATAFTIAPYPFVPDTFGIAYAPYHYWRRNLDSYTQVIQIVDERIGEVLSALPKDVADNTILVFTSDHGEYAGAHGFVSGKVGSLYDEAYHVPLIVVDPTGRFTGDIDVPRDGLTSSVDMLTMLVSLGFSGSRKWMVGPLAELYGNRHDMLPMLRSAQAAGRDHVLLATDEQAPGDWSAPRSSTSSACARRTTSSASTANGRTAAQRSTGATSRPSSTTTARRGVAWRSTTRPTIRARRGP